MIILTGYKGFIGRNFFDNLLKEEVYRVEIDESFNFLEEYDKWDEVKLIIHMGACSSTTERDLNKIHKYNVDFTIKLFEKAIEHGIPVKYASSASVYGNTVGRMNPLNYYAISKLQIDYWVQDNIDRFSKIQGYRFFNVYGKYEENKIKVNQSSPVTKFINDIQKNGVIKLFEGSDDMIRDFVDVSDLVDIVLNKDLPSGIYDIGTGYPISFQEVADLVVKKHGGTIEYTPFPDHLKGKYQYYTCADVDYLDGYKFKNIDEFI